MLVVWGYNEHKLALPKNDSTNVYSIQYTAVSVANELTHLKNGVNKIPNTT